MKIGWFVEFTVRDPQSFKLIFGHKIFGPKSSFLNLPTPRFIPNSLPIDVCVPSKQFPHHHTPIMAFWWWWWWEWGGWDNRRVDGWMVGWLVIYIAAAGPHQHSPPHPSFPMFGLLREFIISRRVINRVDWKMEGPMDRTKMWAFVLFGLFSGPVHQWTSSIGQNGMEDWVSNQFFTIILHFL
jgi:hypothetical protein